MSFLLSADTSCDIFKTDLKARGIAYRPLVYTIDGTPYFDEFTRDEDYKAFYDSIRAGKMPTTSQINIAEHEEFFNSLCEKCDDDIVHITLSSGLSNTYESACAAANEINARFGKKRVHIVDSLGATIATRHVVDEGERLRDLGISAASAVIQLNSFVKHMQTWFMPYDLMHLKRGGRVSGASAVIGTALNIKPILLINKDGGLSVMQKALGAGKGLSIMADIFKKHAAKAAHRVYIASADSDLAEALRDKVKDARPDCDVRIGWIGPVIGAHTGCNAVGVSFLSDEIRNA